MKDLDKLPKSIKKAIRYIKYDTPDHKLKLIENEIKKAFEFRANQPNENQNQSK